MPFENPTMSPKLEREIKLDQLHPTLETQVAYTEQLLNNFRGKREKELGATAPQFNRLVNLFNALQGKEQSAESGIYEWTTRTFQEKYQELLDKKVRIKKEEYENSSFEEQNRLFGIDNEVELTIKELLERDPHTFLTLTVYLPSETETKKLMKREMFHENGKDIVEEHEIEVPEIDLDATFNMYWDGIAKHSRTWLHPYFSGGYYRFPQHQDPEPQQAGLRLEVISMNTYRDRAPSFIRTPNSPSLGILATAASSPKWALLPQNSDDAPSVCIPGIEVIGDPEADEPQWDLVPLLSTRLEGEIILDVSYMSMCDQNQVVPVSRESVNFTL